NDAGEHGILHAPAFQPSTRYSLRRKPLPRASDSQVRRLGRRSRRRDEPGGVHDGPTLGPLRTLRTGASAPDIATRIHDFLRWKSTVFLGPGRRIWHSQVKGEVSRLGGQDKRAAGSSAQVVGSLTDFAPSPKMAS